MQQIIISCKSCLKYAIGAVMLMGICLYNGYPLYGGDTHAYFSAGFDGYLTTDRTPFYGYFIRHTSLLESLWFTIFAQNLLLSFVLIRFIRLILGAKALNSDLLLSVFVTVVFTNISWVSACLMSDIFTPILLLATLLYLLERDQPCWVPVAYFLLMYTAISMHNSHFLTMVMLSGGLIIYSLLARHRQLLKKGIVLLSAGVLFFLTMCCVNAANNNGFTFSKCFRLFTMAKFAETGILEKYLKDNCDKKSLKMCRYGNDITPYPWEFMYSEAAPYRALGGYDSCNEEFGVIIKDVMTTPEYVKLYLLKSAISTARQLSEIQQTGKIYSAPANSWEIDFVKRHFAHEQNEFVRSKQNGGVLDSTSYNEVYMVFFVLTTIWMLFFYGDAINKRAMHIYAIILCFFVINAFVTSTFSTVDCRFQYRIFWILPVANAILMLKYYRCRYCNDKPNSLISASSPASHPLYQ